MAVIRLAASPVEERPDWCRLSADEACRRLDVDPAVGRSAADVAHAPQRFGPDRSAEAAKDPGRRASRRQHRDLVQLLLLDVAVISIVAHRRAAA